MYESLKSLAMISNKIAMGILQVPKHVSRVHGIILYYRYIHYSYIYMYYVYNTDYMINSYIYT